jgi:hypothetical protein
MKSYNSLKKIKKKFRYSIQGIMRQIAYLYPLLRIDYNTLRQERKKLIAIVVVSLFLIIISWILGITMWRYKSSKINDKLTLCIAETQKYNKYNKTKKKHKKLSITINSESESESESEINTIVENIGAIS